MQYVPPELVGCAGNETEILYYCYLIELEPDFNDDIKPHNIVLALRIRLELDVKTLNFDLDIGKGSLMVTMRYIGDIKLASEEVVNQRNIIVTTWDALLEWKLSINSLW